jgi:hypothetical protein
MSSRYSDWEKRDKLDEARELLAELHAQGFGGGGEYRFLGNSKEASVAFDERPAWPSQPDPLDCRQRSSLPMQRWRAEQEETERRRQWERERLERQQEEHVRQMQAKSDESWNAWLNAAIEAERKFMFDVHAQVIAEERKRGRAEIATAVGELRAEMNVKVAAEVEKLRDEIIMKRTSITRDGATHEVIDLPAGSWWRKSDAA